MFYNSPLLEPLLQQDAMHPVLLNIKHKPLLRGELAVASKSLANELHNLGLRENDTVVLTLPGGKEFMTLMYALIMLRARIAIIDPEMGRANFAAKLKQLNPSWAFVDSRILLLNEHPILRSLIFYFKKNIPYFRAPKSCRIVSTGKYMPLLKGYVRLQQLMEKPTSDITLLDKDALHEFLIVYTSGTLQEPKGVVHTAKSLSTSIKHLVQLVGKEAHDLIGTDLPQYMMLGVSTGIPVLLKPAGMKVKQHFDWLTTNNITIMFTPPSELLPLIAFCERTHQKLPNSLRKILLGSAPVHKEFLKRLKKVSSPNLKVICLYGMTELLICASIDGDEKINHEGTEGDVLGKPWHDVTCTISDASEIMLHSPQLFERYFHEQTRQEPHGTGDTGYLDDKGYIILTGRKKDMIIRKGFNIYPVIYETIVKQIPGVDDCAMVGIWSERKQDEEVCLVVETKKLSKTRLQKLITVGEYSLDAQALPDVIVLKDLPRSGRQQKIDKKVLREELRGMQTSQA